MARAPKQAVLDAETERLREQRRLLDYQIALHRAHDEFIPFCKWMMPDPNDPENPEASRYEETPLARVLGDALEKVERGELLRLCVSVGPQLGKSQQISRMFPAWYVGRDPYRHVMLGTYNQPFANEFGSDVREAMTSRRYQQVFKDVAFRKGSENKENLVTTQGGKMAFIGVGGSGSGKPADIFLIDDPIKNREDADSTIYRQTVWNWFNQVAYNRLHNGSAIVIVHCLVGGTLVTMADGTRKPLVEIRPGDKVRAWDAGRWRSCRVLRWADQGEDDVYEVRTGRHRFVGNARHPVLARRHGADTWVRIGELRKGDRLVCSGAERGAERGRVDCTEAWLLGYMFGDGWLTFRNAKNKDKARGKEYPRVGVVTCVAKCCQGVLNDTVLGMFRELFGVDLKETKYGYYRTEKQTVGRWFERHGLTGAAKTKRLPPWLFGEPLDVRRAFLSGLEASDGHVVAATNRCIVGMANGDLVEDVRQLARSAGFGASNISVDRFVTQPPSSKAPVNGCTHRVAWQRACSDEETTLATVRTVKPAGRESVYDIEVEGAGTFVADGVVVHNTRWHEDDLIGRLVDPEHPEHDPKIARDWTYINLPAVVSDEKLAKALGLTLKVQTDPDIVEQFGEKPMSAIWARKQSLKFYSQARRLDPKGFDALRMGKPSPDDGDYFKRDWLVLHKDPREYPPKNELMYYGASDHAVTDKQERDANVIGVVGIDRDDDIWVMPDLVWERMKTDQVVEEMLAKFRQYPILLWWMESELISKSFGPFLMKRMQETRTYVTIDPVVPSKDKKARARSAQGRMSMRKIHFPAWTPWWADAQAELMKFPQATHDDFVDWLSHICMGLVKEVGAPAARESEKVVKVGSVAWVMAQTRQQERAAKAKKAVGGW